MGTQKAEASDAPHYPAIPGQPSAKNYLAQNIDIAEVESRCPGSDCICPLYLFEQAEHPKSTGRIYHGKLVLNAQMDHVPSCLPKKKCVLWYLVEAVLLLAL